MAGLLPLDRQFPGLVDPINVTTQTGVFYASTIYAWSEPVRTRISPRLAIVLAATGFISPNTPPDILLQKLESRWHYAWSEPVRVKPRLHAALNPVTAYTNITPIPNPVLSRWLMPLSEPVRIKPGLKAGLQQTSAWPTRLLPPVNVTITMSARETNNDIFTAAVRISNVPVSVKVDIRETSNNGGFASLEET